MKSFIKLSILTFSVIFFAACNKKDDPPAPGKTYLEFFNVVGGSNLNLNNQWYRNENGDSFRVTKFNYYISNIKLNGTNGATYAEKESYHLIEHSATPSHMAFNMKDVPAGKYKSITFTIGVDSLRNVSGAQDGDLAADKGNFWSWNTGYIMLKFEGNSPKASTPDGMLMMHCGGFSGANSVLKTITLPFPDEIEVTGTATPHIHLQADLLTMFKSPNKISFSNLTTIHMPGADAKKLADNYANMFTVSYAGQ